MKEAGRYLEKLVCAFEFAVVVKAENTFDWSEASQITGKSLNFTVLYQLESHWTLF